MFQSFYKRGHHSGACRHQVVPKDRIGSLHTSLKNSASRWATDKNDILSNQLAQFFPYISIINDNNITENVCRLKE